MSEITMGEMMKECGKVDSADIAEIMRQSQEILKAIQKAVEEQGDVVKSMADEDEKLFNDIIDELKESNKKKPSERVKGKASSSGSSTEKMLASLRKREASSKKSADTMDKAVASIAEGINQQTAILEKLIARAGRSLGGTGRGGSGGGGGGGGGGGVGGIGPDSTEYADEFAQHLGEALRSTLGSVMTGMLGGAAALQLLIKGIVEDEYEYAIGMNQILFLTQGVGDEAKKMQKTFRATSQVVKSTGFDLTTFQTQMMKAAKRGLKDSEAITRTGLNLGKMMGMNEQESSQIADNMADWSQHLGMSEHSIADVSRGIQMTAKMAGLTGQNLAEVVKNSEKFMDNMRSAGSLTAESAKNIISLQAAATKLGVADSMTDSMQAMTNNANLFLKASKETQSLMFMSAASVGRMSELQSGTLLETKQGLKDMSKGLENTFKKFSGGKGFGDIEKMSAGQKATLNLQLEAAFGKGLDDMKREFEAMAAGGRTYAEQMSAIDEEMQGHLTKEEKLTLERKKQDLLLNQSLSFSSGLADAVKNATSFDDAITKMQKGMSPQQWKEKMVDLGDVAGTFSKELQEKVLKGDKTAIAEAMALSGSKALKKSGGKDFSPEVAAAIQHKDFEKLRELQSEMTKEQQKLAVKSVEEMDPIGQAAFYLKQINEGVRAFLGPASVALTGILGATGIMVGYLAAIAAQSYMSYQSFKSGFAAIKSGFKMFGGAGAAAGGEAASGIGGLVSSAAGGLGSLVKVLKVAGPYAAIAGAAIGGVVGALQAGEHAAEIFGVAQRDLTQQQLASAQGAGALTGALNFLTFGIFDSLLGSTGTLTKMLSELFAKSQIIPLIIRGFQALFGILWGVVKAVWEIIKGVGDFIWNILEPFGAVFEAIGELVGSVTDVFFAFLSPLGLLDAKVGESGSTFQMFADLVGSIGKALGWVLGTLGKVVGWLIGTALSPLIAIIKAVATTIGGWAKIISGILTLDPSKIWEGIKQVFSGIPKLIYDAFVSIFVDLPMWLGSVIIDGFKAIFWDLPMMFLDAIAWCFTELPVMLYDGFVNGLSDVWNWIKGLIPGLKGATETPEEREKRIAEEGPSMLEGIGGVIGGALSFDLDKVMGGAGEALSSLNPLNWFEEGTREVQQTGLGVLHKGEAVVPAKELEKLKAEGNGPFGGFLDNFFGGGGMFGGIGSMLSGAFDSLTNSFMPSLSSIGTGAFTPGLGKEAGYMATMQDAEAGLDPAFETVSLLKEIRELLRKGNKKKGIGSGSAISSTSTSEKEVNSAMQSATSELTDKVFDGGINAVSETINKKATSTQQKSASFIDRAIDTAKSVIKTVWDSITGTAETHEAAATVSSEKSTVALESASTALKETKSNTAEMAATDKALQTITKEMSSEQLSNIGHMKAAHFMSLKEIAAVNAGGVAGVSAGVEGQYAQLNASADGLAVPAAVRSGDTTAGVNPVPLTDVHSRVHQENATTTNEARKSLPELTDLVVVNENQLAYLMMLHDDMGQLIDIMKPSNLSGGVSSMATPNTSSNTSPMSSPNYRSWQFGKYQQNASKQVITDGR